MGKQEDVKTLLEKWLPGSQAAEEQIQRLGRALDPFGIVKSFSEVEQAWVNHPVELGEVFTRLAGELWTLHFHLLRHAMGSKVSSIVPVQPDDSRFSDPVWTEHPFYDFLKEYYLLHTHWLVDVIYHTPGARQRDKRQAAFWARQWLNAVAPTNYLLTNPVALHKFWETGGQSLVKGLKRLLDDIGAGDIRMVDPNAFEVGKTLATTPGSVVFRNELLEVIHYTPTTETVHATPIVIIAPWINKFYILDLNERKSLVRHLVNQGFSVFVTSWKNPGPELAETRFDDYMIDGALQAIQVARDICKAPRVHAVGYCLGGTTLAALMAWLNREYPDPEQVPVAHWTLFTTLVDFSRPGAIEVFINEESIGTLEDMMVREGGLGGRQMSQAFRMLRPNSLIWHYYVHGYLYGETPPPFDVLFWNMDVTRLPRAMHSFYLREFYMNNRLVKRNGVTLAGHPIDLSLIRQPLYAVGCEEDHIAPWKATFSIAEWVSAPVRYTLSSSGHILGIINPPVKPPKRSYWTGETLQYNPVEWQKQQAKIDGSWWEDWVGWLGERCGPMVPPPGVGSRHYRKLAAAPGSYVRET